MQQIHYVRYRRIAKFCADSLMKKVIKLIFTARRHASAVYAVVVCLYVSNFAVVSKRLNIGSRKVTQ